MINKYNFKTLYSALKKNLFEADFVAIDFEFTSLHSSPNLELKRTDSDDLMYWKLRHTIEETCPLEIGLATMKEVNGKHVLNSYSIPLVPFDDWSIKVTQSTFGYLSNHKFDFNRVFYEGVGYVRESDWEKI